MISSKYERPPISFAEPPSFSWVAGHKAGAQFTIPEEIRLERKPKNREFRHIAKTQKAAQHLDPLPEIEVTRHMVTRAAFDFWCYVPAILDLAKPAVCEQLFVSTWVICDSNVNEMLRLHDDGRIKNIGILTGVYMKRRSTASFCRMYEGLRSRGQKFAACYNHSKMVALRLSDGNHYVIESSANLTNNGNIEQHVLSNSRPLFDFHAKWTGRILESHGMPPLDAVMAKKEYGSKKRHVDVKKSKFRCVTKDKTLIKSVRLKKTDGNMTRDEIESIAGQITELIMDEYGSPPRGAIVTHAPQGVSFPKAHLAEQLAREIAEKTGLTYAKTMVRSDVKVKRGHAQSQNQEPFQVSQDVRDNPPPFAIVIDDFVTSGTTMTLCLNALKDAKVPAKAFAYGCV